MNRAAAWVLDGALVPIAAGLAVLIVHAALTNPDAAARAPAARLARDPLDLQALRTLGLGLDRQGRPDEAEAALAFVGRRTWRDGPAETWLLRRRLDQGRYKEAFESADSLLRRDAAGATRPTLFALFIAAAGDQAARPALTDRLSAAPWWRGDFLRALGAGGDVAGTRAVFAVLARGLTPPAPDEYAPFINRLVRVGDYGEALEAWRGLARPADAASAALRDGSLSGASDRTPFTWSTATGVGVTSEAEAATDGPARRALRIDYDGYSSPTLPAQLLVGQWARYGLSWHERLEPARPQRLAWQVRCADTNQILARAPPAAPGWRAMTMIVETPPSGCAAQWLELAADPGERREPVTAWYADFRLRPPP